MTDKELKKLSKTELLEMCLMLRETLDKVTQENTELQEKLDEARAIRDMLEEILRLVGGENLEKVNGNGNEKGERTGNGGNKQAKSDS